MPRRKRTRPPSRTPPLVTPEALRGFRRAMRWSREETARQTGVSVRALVYWEQGQKRIPKWLGAILYNLGNAYGLPTASWLPDVAHQEPEPEYVEPVLIYREEEHPQGEEG